MRKILYVIKIIHAKVYHDPESCRHFARNLFANKIPVYFFGALPFIYFKPISGSDINLAKILAKKYFLNMEFNPAKTTSDLVGIVRHMEKNDTCKISYIFLQLLTGF